VIRGGFLWEKVGFDGTYNWKGTWLGGLD
jgi:hypothetical protein